MQVSSIMTDLIEFKDEIFKKVRLLENRLTTEVNTKYSEMNNNYEKLDNRINFISENNDSLLEIVTAQKMNLDKITELESFKNKAEQNMIMHDIKIKSLSSDLDKIKSKYDKTISDNLQVPGYVGPGCQFKTISEYITNNIYEFSKLKNDRDQMKIENIEVKNRLDNILKSTLNLIDTSVLRCQKYSDTKHQDMKNILNNKLNEFSEKNMDLRTQITKTEIQNEEQIQNLKLDVEKLLLMKNELIALTDKKIEEINKKIEAMTLEINSIKWKKKKKQKEKEIINVNTNSSDNYKNKMYYNMKNEEEEEEINNSQINNFNDNKDNNIQNNLVDKNNVLMANSNKDIYNTINQPNNLNNNIVKNIQNKINNKILEQPKTTQFNYINGIKKQNLNKEEKISNLSEDEHSSHKFDGTVPMKMKNINEQYSLDEKIKENKKVEENTLINKIQSYYKNLNSYQKIQEEKKTKDISSPNIGQLNKIEDLNNINNSNNKIIDSKDIANFYKNRKIYGATKIKIHSLEKNKSIPTNNSLNINEFRNKKEESEKEYIENQDYNIISNNNKNIMIKNGKSKPLNLTKNFLKINNTIKINNKENNNFLSTPKEILSNDKSEQKHFILYNNEEQSQIMSQIKTYYNIKKEKNIQKSQENAVDCNVINLNLEKVKRNGSSSNLYLYKDTKLRNNLSEIGMKISPAFGRTTYSFYNRKDINSINIGTQNNKKINSLKDRLNLAFVSSIKQRINLKDKAINVQ